MRSAISNAALRAGATPLNLISHRRQAQGVTGLTLLAAAPISFHRCSESGYNAVVVITCGEHTRPERACHGLVEEFGGGHPRRRSLRHETSGMIAGLDRQPAAMVNPFATVRSRA